MVSSIELTIVFDDNLKVIPVSFFIDVLIYLVLGLINIRLHIYINIHYYIVSFYISIMLLPK